MQTGMLLILLVIGVEFFLIYALLTGKIQPGQPEGDTYWDMIDSGEIKPRYFIIGFNEAQMRGYRLFMGDEPHPEGYKSWSKEERLAWRMEKRRKERTRTFGYFDDLEVAKEAVTENWYDIWEYTYDYMLIEAVFEGVHSHAEKVQWFKFSEARRVFEPIEAPAEVRMISNFACG